MILRIEENGKEIQYDVNHGSIKAINEFKKFIGPGKFEQIVQGAVVFDIPLEEEEYEQLMKIVLSGLPEGISTEADIPYQHAEEIISFFCKPFAGRQLKQLQSMLDGISSLLQKVDPEILRTAMESTLSPTKNGSSTASMN